MKSEIIWIQLSLVIGLLVCWSDGKAFDMDSIKETMEMGAMNAAGIAMEMANNFQPSGGFGGGFGFSSSYSSSSDDDRKRRRRSTDDEELSRQKRSPCGRRRRMQTTQATPADAAGGAAGGDGNGNTDDQDLPRRRRRSPNENDIDENIDVIPVPRKFDESAQELGERIRLAVKRALETMNGMLEAIGNNLRNAFNKDAQDPAAM